MPQSTNTQNQNSSPTNNPKYSIIVPAKNGYLYLPTCVQTILEQNYTNYELIISDDHSTDNTKSYLATLNHPNVRIVEPPSIMSMTEHWEWALSLAKGEWLIFVGQDDGLQSYFFQFADRLTDIAMQNGIRTVMSERAYYFWKGCEFIYHDSAISYRGSKHIKFHNSRIQAIRSLLGLQTYFELPEMYTTSLFHRSLIEQAKNLQNGKVFSAHPQDANLAAIACSLESRYMKSMIPLGWVGTSPKSAGMAISSKEMTIANGENKQTLSDLRQLYEKSIQKSNLPYEYNAGDFTFGSLTIYFWQALIRTSTLRANWINKILESKPFKYLLLACAWREMIANGNIQSGYAIQFQEILRRNDCKSWLIFPFARLIHLMFFITKISTLPYRVMRKIYRVLFNTQIKFDYRHSSESEVSLLQSSSIISKAVFPSQSDITNFSA